MQQAELKTLLRKTNEFAISPTVIQEEIPWGHKPQRSGNKTICPTGLVKAMVISANAEWTDKTTFGCSEKAHTIQRKGGVLVQIDLPENWKKERIKKIRNMELTFDAHGNEVVVMVVKKAAVIMPWNEYEPIQRQREREQQESDERYARLRETAETLGVYDAVTEGNAGYRTRWNSDGKTRHYEGYVTLNLDRAEQVATGLDLLRQALDSGQLRDTIIGEAIEKFLADEPKKPEVEAAPKKRRRTSK